MEEVWTVVMGRCCAETGDGENGLCAQKKATANGGLRIAKKVSSSDHFLRELALGVLGGDHLQRLALDLGALAFAAELDVALLADLLGGFARGLEPFAGV